MFKPTHCSIIIVTFNSSSYISGCLTPLMEMSGVEIIVVDNCSQDNTLAILKKDFPTVTTIPLKTNIGFGRASNRGVEESQGEFVFLLNPDTIPSASTIHTACHFLKTHPRAGIVGAQLIDRLGHPMRSCGGNPSLHRTVITKVRDLVDRTENANRPLPTTLGIVPSKQSSTSQPVQVSWVSGAALCCRRSTWEHMGGLDENFFLYFEDVDFCMRAVQEGWEVWYVPTVNVIHFSGASFGGNRRYHAEVYRASQRYFYRKHNGFFSSFLLSLVQGLYFRLGQYG